MIILNNNDLQRLDTLLEELNQENDETTVYSLDESICKLLGVDSVFQSSDEEIIRFKYFQRLIYKIQFQEEDNKVYDSILIVRFRVNLNETMFLSCDYSNVITHEIMYDCLGLHSADDVVFYNKINDWTCMLFLEIKDELATLSTPFDDDRIREIFQTMIDNGI